MIKRCRAHALHGIQGPVLVALANSGKQSVAQIALDHRLNANQLRKWIKESESASGDHQLVPVSVEQPEQEVAFA